MEQLNVEMLKGCGAFTGGPVKKEVEWTSGGESHKADVYIRPISYHTAVSDSKSIRDGENVLANRIVNCVCHEDGSPVFTLSDITGIDEKGNPIMTKVDGEKVERGPLCKSLTDALIMLITEVSGLGKTSQTKDSQEKMNSGTSSSSTESQEEQ